MFEVQKLKKSKNLKLVVYFMYHILIFYKIVFSNLLSTR
jgi:hypothetical protein